MNQLIGSTGKIAIRYNYLSVAAGFSNVALLTITRDAGWFVMDYFTTTALLLLGLLAMALDRIRAKHKALPL